MNIRIPLSANGIRHAQNEIRKIRDKFASGEIIRVFLEECTQYILAQTEFYLDNSGLGENVISDIKSHWVIQIMGNRAVMTNNSNKAVFVEFGVGIVGKGDPHPKASEEGYKYDVDKPTKDEDRSWHFYSDEVDLDIPKSAIDYGVNGKGENNRMSIYTRGTKGVWYSYNALQDLIMNIRDIWNNVKRKVIG